MQDAVNAALDGQKVEKGVVETTAAKIARISAEVEKKRLDEQEVKKKAEQQNVGNKVKEFLFNKKWSNGDIPCNLNGGDYYVYSNNEPSGAQTVIRGKKIPDSKQMQDFSFDVEDEKNIIYVREIRAKGNDLMVKLTGNPYTFVGKTVIRITIKSPDRIEYRGVDHMIDLDNLLKTGKVSYESKNISGYRTLCKM